MNRKPKSLVQRARLHAKGKIATGERTAAEESALTAGWLAGYAARAADGKAALQRMRAAYTPRPVREPST